MLGFCLIITATDTILKPCEDSCGSAVWIAYYIAYDKVDKNRTQNLGCMRIPLLVLSSPASFHSVCSS